MPETFGSGTSGSSFDPRCVPASFGRGQLASGDTETVGLTESLLYIVTHITAVAQGPVVGGEPHFSFASDGTIFWTINVGDSTDQFDYRGFLVVVGGESEGIVIDNDSDAQLHYAICGFASPQFPIV